MMSTTDQSLVLGAVTFLDVLGWKGIWTRDNNAVSKLQLVIAAARERLAHLVQEGQALFEGLRGAQLEEKKLRVESISDTIVLLTEGDAQGTLWLHGELCKVILCQSIERRIPVRGATTYGKYFMSTGDDRMMVGPAIDEAASWHEASDWIGVNQTPSAFLLYDETLASSWVKYKVPLKAGRPVELPCVNWTGFWNETHPGHEADLRRTFTEMGPLDLSISSKYLNTFDFYQARQKQKG